MSQQFGTPSAAPTRAAPTRAVRRRFWFDPRFVIGIVLVVVSVFGVWFVVSTNDKTIAVYSAASTLTPGTVLSDDDLVVTHVRLGAVEGNYVLSGALPGAGALLTRTIPKGELLPRSAITDASSVGVSPVVVHLAGVLPASVDTGSVVDTWAAEPVEGGGFGQPVVIVDGATVNRVIEDDAMVGGAQVSVELLVPKGDVATVLAAVANGHALSLVPRAVS
ncbi:SAF domain-containing protein [Paramicrobacterium humi]|nr:SAF domain-containing protein [Microbacterium humi]